MAAQPDPLAYQVIQTFHPATFFAWVLRRHKKADPDDRLDEIPKNSLRMKKPNWLELG
jgi:hypothetical protein